MGGWLAISETTGDSVSEADHRFFHYDANGNVVAVANEVGTIQAQYRYDGFGREIASAGPLAQVNEYRFSTKPTEKVTGQSYYGFRYYIPEMGRWASRDPIGERGGANVMGFVGNRGIGRFDLLGMEDPITPVSTFRIGGPGEIENPVSRNISSHAPSSKKITLTYNAEKQKIEIATAGCFVFLEYTAEDKWHELRHVEDAWLIWNIMWERVQKYLKSCASREEFIAFNDAWKKEQSALEVGYGWITASRHANQPGMTTPGSIKPNVTFSDDFDRKAGVLWKSFGERFPEALQEFLNALENFNDRTSTQNDLEFKKQQAEDMKARLKEIRGAGINHNSLSFPGYEKYLE